MTPAPALGGGPRESGPAETTTPLAPRAAGAGSGQKSTDIDHAGTLRLLASGASWQCQETAALLEDAADEIERLRAALIRLRDCDWVVTPLDRMDAVRNIARAALNGEGARPHD